VVDWKRAVGLSPDAQVNDDEAVVSLGHPDFWGGIGVFLNGNSLGCFGGERY
jgi:hypothetical protein